MIAVCGCRGVWKVRRQALGAVPVWRAKAARKFEADLKPTWRATSSTGRSEDSSISWARRTRCRVSHCGGEWLVSSRKRRLSVR